MSLVYLHRRKDDPSYIFYVGIGTKTRPISHKDRNDEWHKEVKEHGFLIEESVIIAKKFSICSLLKKTDNIDKIIPFYSWKGAHFIDSKIRGVLPEYKDKISWKDAIRHSFETFNAK